MSASDLNRREFLARSALAAGSALLGNLAGSAAEPPADDPASWAQFLGPRRDNLSTETGLNLDWTGKKPPVLWKAPIGSGFSSVAVVGDRVYTMAGRGGRDLALCLDAKTGKDIWTHDAAPTYLDKQRQGPGPRSTPTYHRGKVYCLLPMGELLCINAADGKEVWKADIFKSTGAKNPAGEFYYWGMSGSPLVEGDLVVVQPGGSQSNSVAAYHKDTGKLVWGAGSDPAGYSSAIAVTAGGKRQIISYTGQSVLSVEPAKGEVLWRYVIGNKFDCNCATPLWIDNTLFVSSAYGTGSAALEIVADGAKPAVKEKWRNKNLQNQFTTSVIVGGHIYGSHGDLGAKMLRCVDLASGQVKWEDRRPAKCSLLGFEKHLLVLSENGTVRLVEANPTAYTVKGELDGIVNFKCWSAPVLLDKRLYLRDDKQLVCLDLAKG
ncbi:MAG: PQQ-binding-like beta-propeller repeat protein [Planctomycetia bacterium]|nr:PQQ-binding-like beta-propeller repeat protein [Planctomycetia bacterium]